MTATGGAFLSSCHVKVLPESNAVPAAWKYSGDMLNAKGSATAFDGLRAVVPWGKMCSPLSPPMVSSRRTGEPLLTDVSTEPRPSYAAAHALQFRISPGLFTTS